MHTTKILKITKFLYTKSIKKNCKTTKYKNLPVSKRKHFLSKRSRRHPQKFVLDEVRKRLLILSRNFAKQEVVAYKHSDNCN